MGTAKQGGDKTHRGARSRHPKVDQRTGISVRALALAALAVSLAGLSASAGAAAGRCATPPGARVLARSSVARVWVVKTYRNGGEYRVWTACLKARDRRVELARGDGFADSATTLPAVALAGDLVGYGVERKSGLGASRATVYVGSLRTGRLLYHRHAVRSIDGLELFDSLVLSAGGSMAWMGENVAGVAVPEVWERRNCGSVLLDQGAGIDVRSLRLRGGRVSWRDGGATRAAQLLPAAPGQCK